MKANLVEMRLNKGLSLREAAAAMKINREVLRMAEQGRTPFPRSAKRIADFYDMRVTDIWSVDEVDGAEAAA